MGALARDFMNMTLISLTFVAQIIYRVVYMYPTMFIFIKTMLCKYFKTDVRAKHCRIFVNIRKLSQKEKSKNTSDQNFKINLFSKKERN